MIKVVVVMLVVIVVLFVVFSVWGKSKNASEPKTDESNFDPAKHSTLGSVNEMLAPFGPKLQAKDLQPPLTNFNLSSNPHYAEKVLPDSNHKFRQARLTVQLSKTCAHVLYYPIGSNLPDKLKKIQDSDASDDKKHPNQFTFTIVEGGGTLTIDRAPSYPAGACEVILQ
jgi:hypothetical protein